MSEGGWIYQEFRLREEDVRSSFTKNIKLPTAVKLLEELQKIGSLVICHGDVAGYNPCLLIGQNNTVNAEEIIKKFQEVTTNLGMKDFFDIGSIFHVKSSLGKGFTFQEFQIAKGTTISKDLLEKLQREWYLLQSFASDLTDPVLLIGQEGISDVRKIIAEVQKQAKKMKAEGILQPVQSGGSFYTK